MDEDSALAMVSALSDRTRLRVVRYLVDRGTAGASAGEIASRVEASSSRASFHLAALEKAGIARSERRSRNIIYHANIANLGAVLSYLLNECCGAHPDILACCAPDARKRAKHTGTAATQ